MRWHEGCCRATKRLIRRGDRNMSRILLVDDEPSILSVLNTLLSAEGYAVESALGGEKARKLILSETFDLMICDIRMSPINGMELLKLVHDERPELAVIMLTAYGSVETAIESLKLGAFDYITKPFSVDELLITVRRALEYRKALSENEHLKVRLEAHYQLDNIVAESKAMLNICDMIRKVAPTDTTVMITGESGTGKEVVAKAIHACSPRHEQPFLAVNCAALPEPLLESEMFGHVKGAFTGASVDKEGLFEAAAGGTLFLDEIGSIPMNIQGKLLRTLQEKEVRRVGSNKTVPVDVRLLAASNQRLEDQIRDGKFREDLYYRISVIPLEIPPLRQRPEDILPLTYHFLRKETPEERSPPSPTPEVCRLLEAYEWPGNVRELENAVKHALTFARDDTLTPDVFPPRMTSSASATAPGGGAGREAERGKSLKAFLREKEKEYLRQVLELTGGNKEEAARKLKISLATLYRKLPDIQE